MKDIVIIGAGPAALSAADQLLQNGGDYRVTILEASDAIGGISRTVCHNGNRMDIGGHRFFSKSDRVNQFWQRFMPMQGAQALDDILLHTPKQIDPDGPDPETDDVVMLRRRRVSRIFYLKKFFDYPVSLKLQTLRNMGLARTLRAGMGFLCSNLHKLPEDSLENFYINRFGRPLYSMFFEKYTEKVWGIHPSRLGADWGSQRVKGLSVTAIFKDMCRKAFGTKTGANSETSLIEEFIYPKHGPGQLWETVADTLRQRGCAIKMNCEAVGLEMTDGKVTAVKYTEPDGALNTMKCDYLLSSMPVKDLVAAFDKDAVPPQVASTAAELPYRDFITVGLLVDRLSIENTTKIPTFDRRVPDTWVYIQEPDVKLGRLQVFNNWSPYLVADYRHTMWLGLEYFCSEGDEMWCASDAAFISMAIDELVKIGVIRSSQAVLDSVRIKVKKAYPAYHGAYYNLCAVRDWLDIIPNLFCIGRNGQHRYNNMDHSMLTGMIAADLIAAGTSDKSSLWAVNTDEEYHESK